MATTHESSVANRAGGNFAMQFLFQDWIVPSTGRLSQRNSNQGEVTEVNKSILLALGDLVDDKIQEEFHQKFLYGVQMEIWRKGNIKKVFVFLDQNIQSLLWISSKTKAFLIDLTYATLHRFDFQLQKQTQVPDYLVIKYFGQEIPFLFRDETKEEIHKLTQLFQRYITWNKEKSSYPPYFSRIMKLYTMQVVKQSISRRKSISQILKISETIGFNDLATNKKILHVLYHKDGLLPKIENDKNFLKIQLDDSEVAKYFKILHCIDKLLPIFQRLSSQTIVNQLQYLKACMKKSQFQKFLLEEQHQGKQKVAQIIAGTKEFLSFYDFCSFLECEKTNYAACAPKVDQTLPLNQYYCYSSHNTYLSGNQITSDCKIERYLEDLTGGIKCVEIDVHNDGAVPIITHAVKDKSLCKPIDFEETIKEINRFCEDNKGHYPIVLSIQNHAKEQNRYKMLNILLKYFQQKLLFLTDQYKNEEIKQCRSLEYLRGKIILKTDSKLEEILTYHLRKKKEFVTPMSKMVLPFTYEEKVIFKNKQFQEKYDKFHKFIAEQQKRKLHYDTGIPKILFLPISQMTKVTSLFKSPTGIQNKSSTGYECTSLTNQKVMKTNEELLVGYTKRSWLRTYPIGTQIYSSNYNPVKMLKVGAQIIALNTQTKDNYAWLMMSYFTAGRDPNPSTLGYVDKPIHLRTSTPYVQRRKTYNITLLHQTQTVSIDFFGSEEDMRINKKSQNIFIVEHSNEGFLMFKINQKLRDCIPLRFIRTGYRVLVAKNQFFLDSGVRVLIKIEIQE